MNNLNEFESEAINCFAYKSPTECLILTKKNCFQCKFFKTKERLAFENKKTTERLGSLKPSDDSI